ncbi:N-acetylmuramoyl-L-alanine amidase [Oryzicola mucosus]|uniref:N-acetylmuramoyl-L-alanine amidase n=1 Tax=Oryzicola mucosus TaxID=2767425 RepID=A0A8J6PNS4_9HYPH|nr:N-acetylmuramoyl-L-alanine amidase [Oryzicola mucosus]MBD0414870.1 amidase [Oryzicola mucosus]
MFGVSKDRLTINAAPVEFVKSPHISGKMTPEFLVIHYTASGPSSDIASYFSKPSAQVSAHLVITRNGTVKQCVPFNVIGWHAGKSEWRDRSGNLHVGLNQNSIGIEIENWGPLKRAGSGWVSWTGESVDGGKVIEARHKFGAPNCGWEVFTDAQVEATINAAQAICDAYGIKEIVGHDDIAPGRKSDPGPAWNMRSFIAKVIGRKENGSSVMVVRSPTGLNVRKGPGAAFDMVRKTPLADGTSVEVHEADGSWRFVSVLDAKGLPDFSGWVHGAFLREG